MCVPRDYPLRLCIVAARRSLVNVVEIIKVDQVRLCVVLSLRCCCPSVFKQSKTIDERTHNNKECLFEIGFLREIRRQRKNEFSSRFFCLGTWTNCRVPEWSLISLSCLLVLSFICWVSSFLAFCHTCHITFCGPYSFVAFFICINIWALYGKCASSCNRFIRFLLRWCIKKNIPEID